MEKGELPSASTSSILTIRQFYTLNAESVRVLKESPTPFSTAITTSPPHSSVAEDTPLISAQDEFDSFTTKKRTETRTDDVVDAKSETTPEMTIDHKGEGKATDVQPKPSSSRTRKPTKPTKPTISDLQINDMDTTM